MFLASAGISIERKGAATKTAPMSLLYLGARGCLWACRSAALWEAQGTLCDSRATPVPGREGGGRSLVLWSNPQ